MAYYVSPKKVAANRALLDDIARAMVEGRTLTYDVDEGANISAEATRLRVIIASAARFPQESYDAAIHGNVRIKQDMINNVILIEPGITADALRKMALRGRDFNDAIKAWGRLERAEERELELVVEFQSLEEAAGFIEEVDRRLGWSCRPDPDRSDGNRIHLDCERAAIPTTQGDRAFDLLKERYGPPQG